MPQEKPKVSPSKKVPAFGAVKKKSKTKSFAGPVLGKIILKRKGEGKETLQPRIQRAEVKGAMENEGATKQVIRPLAHNILLRLVEEIETHRRMLCRKGIRVSSLPDRTENIVGSVQNILC
jgi:hypothetical protein